MERTLECTDVTRLRLQNITIDKYIVTALRRGCEAAAVLGVRDDEEALAVLREMLLKPDACLRGSRQLGVYND